MYCHCCCFQVAVGSTRHILTWALPACRSTMQAHLACLQRWYHGHRHPSQATSNTGRARQPARAPPGEDCGSMHCTAPPPSPRHVRQRHQHAHHGRCAGRNCLRFLNQHRQSPIDVAAGKVGVVAGVLGKIVTGLRKQSCPFPILLLPGAAPVVNTNLIHRFGASTHQHSAQADAPAVRRRPSCNGQSDRNTLPARGPFHPAAHRARHGRHGRQVQGGTPHTCMQRCTCAR